MTLTIAQSQTCVACEGPLNPLRRYRLDGRRGKALFGSAHISRCAECNLVQMTPLPSADELHAYYSRLYRSGGRHGAREASLDDFPRDNLFYYHRGRSIVDLMTPYLPSDQSGPLNILDVGAGFGHTLAAVTEEFPTAHLHAVEISEVCVAHLRANDVSVHESTVEAWAEQTDVTSNPVRYDLIILSHVLEHVRDPLRILTLLESRLQPGGLLYLEVPNIPLDLLDRYPDHPWAPRWDEPHLTFFSESSLASLLQRLGLEQVLLQAAGPSYRTISALRYHVPPLRTMLLAILPATLTRLVRRQKITTGLQSFAQEAPFYRYAPDGVWLRGILRKSA